MDYYNKIIILEKYFKQQIDKQDIEYANKTLLSIKILHGKIIEHILMLKESREDNKLELLSDLERINYKIISIIDNCEELYNKKDNKKNNEKNNENNNDLDNDNDLDDDDSNNNDEYNLDKIESKKEKIESKKEKINKSKKEQNINNSKLNKKIPSLILFYAEWCGHCKHLMPTWNALTDLLPKDKINILKISCVEKEKQCNSIKEIKGYPTIIYIDIELNKKIIYSGERTAESIINFINNSNGSEIIKLTT